MLPLVAASLSPSVQAAKTNADSLNAIARDYVVLQLAIGEKEEGYIDAYYGPAELQAKGKALGAKSDLKALRSATAALGKRLSRASAQTRGADVRRARFLAAQLTASDTRLRMLQGEKLSFDEEARGLFGVVPDLKPLSAYKPVLVEIERLVPGTGPIGDRVDAFQNRFTIPKERLKPVFDAAIAACRERTLRRFPMPGGEKFDMAFVTGKAGPATITIKETIIRRSRSTPTCRSVSAVPSISVATKAIRAIMHSAS